jgi:quercetin dioxygenase-like cupin family protein
MNRHLMLSTAGLSRRAALRRAGLIGAGLGLGGLLGRASAQEATPAASGITDVKVETLGFGPSSVAPGNTLLLIRLTFAPGGSIALHTHPGDAVFAVQSGRITWTTGEGTPLLTRAAAAAAIAAGTPTPPESLVAGEEVVLEPGDAVFYDRQTSHAVRNDGTEEAIVLYSALRAADQPGISFL